MLGTSGNLSILIEGSLLQFLITASGKDKGNLTEDDFILVDENAKAVQENSLKPSDETLLHSTIYKHANAQAVFHVHTTNSTILSQHVASSSRLEFSGLEMLKGLGFKTHDVKVQIPIVENSQDMKYLASGVPSYINEDVPGFLLKGHGIYAWGHTVQEAKRHVEIFEFLFEYRVKELSLTSKL